VSTMRRCMELSIWCASFEQRRVLTSSCHHQVISTPQAVRLIQVLPCSNGPSILWTSVPLQGAITILVVANRGLP